MRLRLLISGMLAFICVAKLHGAPDPDLFDGRFSAATSDSSITGDGADEKGEGLGGDESSGEVEGNGESSSEATAKVNTGVEGQTTGSGKPGSESSAAEASTSAAGSGRSFEEFEVGAVDKTNGQIDINRSKEFSSQSEPASISSSQTENSDVQNSDQNAQKSGSATQESYDGTGSADYGTSVPSGL